MGIFNEGRQYKLLIDPLLSNVHKNAAGMIPQGANVIDIACGNGTLALLIAQLNSKVVGIDLSSQSIEYARKRTFNNGIENAVFIERNAEDLSLFSSNEFDVATISMAIHQFRLETAYLILEQMKRIANKIIMVDYQVPLPGGFSGTATRIIERIAGKEHNRNFSSYLKHGGLPQIIKDLSFTVDERPYQKSVFIVYSIT